MYLLYVLYSEPSRMLMEHMYLLYALYSEPSRCSLSMEHICICYMYYTLNHLECSFGTHMYLLYALYSEPSRMTTILLIRSLIVICSSSFSSRNFATSKNASILSSSSGRPSFTFLVHNFSFLKPCRDLSHCTKIDITSFVVDCICCMQVMST